MAVGYGVVCQKPEPLQRTRNRRRRVKGTREAEVRVYVFARERDICRCCRKRRADSMHEIISRGAGGKVSRRNSIAVCGQIVGAVPSCHTYMQLYQIDVVQEDDGAEGTLTFWPKNHAAADWMQIALGQSVKSEPMVVMEAAE